MNRRLTVLFYVVNSVANPTSAAGFPIIKCTYRVFDVCFLIQFQKVNSRCDSILLSSRSISKPGTSRGVTMPLIGLSGFFRKN